MKDFFKIIGKFFMGAIFTFFGIKELIDCMDVARDKKDIEDI